MRVPASLAILALLLLAPVAERAALAQLTTSDGADGEEGGVGGDSGVQVVGADSGSACVGNDCTKETLSKGVQAGLAGALMAILMLLCRKNRAVLALLIIWCVNIVVFLFIRSVTLWNLMVTADIGAYIYITRKADEAQSAEEQKKKHKLHKAAHNHGRSHGKKL